MLHKKLRDQLDDWEGEEIIRTAFESRPPSGYQAKWDKWYCDRFILRNDAIGHGASCRILLDNIKYVHTHWGASDIDAIKLFGGHTRLDHHAELYSRDLIDYLVESRKWRPENYSPTFNYVLALAAIARDDEDRYVYRLEQTIKHLDNYDKSAGDLLVIAEDDLKERFPEGVPANY